LSCLLLTAVLSAVLTVNASAAETSTYILNELNLSVNIPSSLVVFTRDFDPDDPNLKKYGLTDESLTSAMESGNMYLDCWDKNISYEMFITYGQSTLNSFNDYDDATLSSLADCFGAQYKSVGVIYIKAELYDHPQVKFIKSYFKQANGGSTVYGIQYYTLYDNQLIGVTLRSYSGKITSKNESTIKSIVDSIKLRAVSGESGGVSVSALPIVYSDSETDMSFQVPAGWTDQTDTEEKAEHTTATFVSDKNSYINIEYRSFDLWSEMTDSQKAGLSRADCNSASFTKERFAKDISIPETDITSVTYNGIEYYQVQVTKTDSSLGKDMEYKTTRLAFMDNGYLFTFSFSGKSDNIHYGDFESLLNSVSYTLTNGSDSSLFSLFNPATLIISLIVTIVIYSLPIFIYRYGIRKAPVESRKAKKITTVYAIIGFVLMCILVSAVANKAATGGGLFLWSYVNYKMLTSGLPKENGDAPAPVYGGKPSLFGGIKCAAPSGENAAPSGSGPEKQAPEERSVSQTRFCYKCGNRLQPDSVFCDRCGAKRPDLDPDLREYE